MKQEQGSPKRQALLLEGSHYAFNRRDKDEYAYLLCVA